MGGGLGAWSNRRRGIRPGLLRGAFQVFPRRKRIRARQAAIFEQSVVRTKKSSAIWPRRRPDARAREASIVIARTAASIPSIAGRWRMAMGDIAARGDRSRSPPGRQSTTTSAPGLLATAFAKSGSENGGAVRGGHRDSTLSRPVQIRLLSRSEGRPPKREMGAARPPEEGVRCQFTSARERPGSQGLGCCAPRLKRPATARPGDCRRKGAGDFAPAGTAHSSLVRRGTLASLAWVAAGTRFARPVTGLFLIPRALNDSTVLYDSIPAASEQLYRTSESECGYGRGSDPGFQRGASEPPAYRAGIRRRPYRESSGSTEPRRELQRYLPRGERQLDEDDVQRPRDRVIGRKGVRPVGATAATYASR